jgi:glyoxylase I family protein
MLREGERASAHAKGGFSPRGRWVFDETPRPFRAYDGAVRFLRLDHVSLSVRDAERSLRFYRDLLGFPLVQVAELSGGGKLYYLEAGTGRIELLHRPATVADYEPAPPTQADIAHFCIQVEDLDACLRHLEAAGVRFQGPKRTSSSGRGTIQYVLDPDGFPIEMMEPFRR